MSNRRRLRAKTSRHDVRLSPKVQAYVDGLDHYDGGQRHNIYTCETCNGTVLTVDIDNGVTPASMACYASEHCHGRAWSSWYSVPPERRQDPAVLEWYRPESLRGLSDYERDHVQRGGLLHRPGPGAPDWVNTAHGLPAGA